MRHDIVSYFLKIRGLLRILREEDGSESIDNISNLLTEMKELIDHSVELADAGLIINLDQIVDLDVLVKMVAKRHIPPSIQYEQVKLPRVRADDTKLRQVMQNLIDNALVHGQPTEISIGLIESENTIKLSIENDGTPIPQEIHEHIFKRGFSTKEGRKGFGLTVALRIIEAHGWKLEISNSEKTAFIITIPKDSIMPQNLRI
jgi:signal transduction histidine kinase